MIHDVLAELKRYCAELGAEPEVAADEETRKRLPLFLSQIYEPVRATLFGRPLTLFILKRSDNPTPVELEKHSQTLGRQFGPDLGFVFPSLPAFERNRLLKRRIPFIVPRRQMFLPGVMVDLREVHGTPALPKSSAPLSTPAQLILLFHLQKRGGEGPFALHAWAKALRYSSMSITRAQRELVNAGLATSLQPSKEIIIQFAADRRELWQNALPMLRSPVQKEEYYRVNDLHRGMLLNAGLTALAHYTDIAEGRQRCLAAWRLFLRGQPEMEPLPYQDADTVLIQSWLYPPILLTEDNQTVDRLSLYLSFRESTDERVQAALAQVLRGVKW